MKQTKEPPLEKIKGSGSIWINRLAQVPLKVDAMDPEERAAAFRFMKSKYSKDWPSESY